MTEMNGLANVIGSAGTLHSIAPPPDREDFADPAEYERAYHEWWLRTTFWHASVRRQ